MDDGIGFDDGSFGPNNSFSNTSTNMDDTQYYKNNPTEHAAVLAGRKIAKAAVNKYRLLFVIIFSLLMLSTIISSSLLIHYSQEHGKKSTRDASKLFGGITLAVAVIALIVSILYFIQEFKKRKWKNQTEDTNMNNMYM